MAGSVRLGVVVLLAGFSIATAGAALTPEETVRRYLQAVKEAKFDDAYGLISRAMKGGKEREVWIKEQQRLMQWADVKIFDFHVYPGKVAGDKAEVPNVLSSQDRFANQLGLTEHELYTLVKEDGTWKVDQQVLVEPPDIPKWFPKQDDDTGGAVAPPSH
jgi:hypothetical protein